MTVDYGKALGNGLRFCIQPRRWLPFFVLDLVFVSIFLAMLALNASAITTALLMVRVNPMAIFSLGTLILGIVVLFGIWWLLRLWIVGAVLHQAYKEKEFNKSFTVGKQKFLSILAVIVVVSIISAAVNMIPFIGWILALVVAWIFFFSLQGVVVSGLGFARALENSYKIFRKTPFKVFLMWLIVTIIAMVITLVFLIPAFMMFSDLFTGMASTGASGTAILIALMLVLQTNILVIALVGIIGLIGTSLSQCFTLKAQTEFYLQLKKKKLGIF